VLFFYSLNRNGEHSNRHLAGYAGILQADAMRVLALIELAERVPPSVGMIDRVPSAPGHVRSTRRPNPSPRATRASTVFAYILWNEPSAGRRWLAFAMIGGFTSIEEATNRPNYPTKVRTSATTRSIASPESCG
jgi:hypothetical protein